MIVCGVACCSPLVIVSTHQLTTMSRKKIFTDEELVAMVLEHHDSNDDVDSLYGFSESSSDSSFESEGIETPEPDPIPRGSNAHASGKEVSPATLPQQPIQIGRAMYFTVIFTKLFIPGQSFILQHKTMYVRIPEDLFCKCGATKIQDMHIEGRSVQLMLEYWL